MRTCSRSSRSWTSWLRAAGSDPVEFRLAHLPDPRGPRGARGCCRGGPLGRALAQADRQRPRGRGFAFSRYENHKVYAAVAIELEVDLATLRDKAHWRAAIAADAGQIVDPDGLENQLEGGLIQAASLTLEERSLRRAGCHHARLGELPDPALRPRAGGRDRARSIGPSTSLGAGEATTGPTSAAIANAVFAATGVRLRDTPFTPARLRGALFR